MGVESTSTWLNSIEDLNLEVKESPPPEGRSGSWQELLARFTRHSFCRVLFSAAGDEATIVVEIALGPPGEESPHVAAALHRLLARSSQSEWKAQIDELPWRYQTEFSSEQKDAQKLRPLLEEILSLTARFESTTTSKEWLEALAGTQKPAESSAQDKASTPTSPFETIGGGATTALTRIGDEIRMVLGFTTVLPPGQLEALIEGIESHLNAKFDIQARHTAEALDRPELRLPSTVQTTAQFIVRPGGYEGSLDALSDDLGQFLHRIEKFSSYGVDLLEYFGVGQTLFDSAHRAASPARNEENDHENSDDEGFVLAIDSAPAERSDRLTPGDFEDPRLRQDDADTPLVDLVLRHPGYSDRRIGQVLSILLSIEYHDALSLADAAPCVIAWGIGRQRAASFQEVINSAGGKALLVAPGTFEER